MERIKRESSIVMKRRFDGLMGDYVTYEGRKDYHSSGTSGEKLVSLGVCISPH